MHRKLWECVASPEPWKYTNWVEFLCCRKMDHGSKLMPVTFFWEGGSLIRACTGSFGNVFGAVNLGNNKMGQIFLSQKRRS